MLLSPLLRLLYRSYRISATMQSWGERRLTRTGLGVVVATVIAAIIGPDTENNVAYQGFTLLACLLALAFVWSWYFRGKFSVARVLPRFGTAGQPLRYKVWVRNDGRQPQNGLTLLETLAHHRPAYEEWVAAQKAELRHARSFRLSRAQRTFQAKAAKVKDVAVPPLPPRQEVEVPVEVVPTRRGLLRFEKVTLARPDPMGLFRAFIKVPAAQSALILPKRYPLPSVQLPGSMRYQQGGVALASHIGRSDEFVSLRDYRRGDPLRHIHWRSWAKAGRPVVREFEDEFFVRHALVLDTFTDNPLSEAFEEAVSVAASFACTIQTQESLLDLLFVGAESYCFTSGRGLAHADQMLEILASVRPCTNKPFRDLDHIVVRHSRSVSGVICVLLAWDEARQEFIKRIKLLGVPVLVTVVVEPGRKKQLDPGPLRDEPHQFHVLEAGKIEQGLAKM